MSYIRVIPRDLFNESNLLKCYGKLALELDRLQGHSANLHEGDGSPFKIEQDEGSGSLTIANIPFTIGGRQWVLSRPLNSRRPWPLYAENDDESVSVFEDNGELTPEFAGLIGVSS
jgi:hypothetical protein